MDKVSGVRVRLLPTTKIAALMNHQHLSLAPTPLCIERCFVSFIKRRLVDVEKNNA